MVGAELATEPADRDRLQDGVTRVDRGDGGRRSSRSSTTSPTATTRPRSSCSPARPASPPRSTSPRTVVRRAEREAVAATAAGWLEPREPRGAVPEPPRRPRVHARPLAGGRVPPRPRALIPPTARPRTPYRRNPWPSPSPRPPSAPTPSGPTSSSCRPDPTGRSAPRALSSARPSATLSAVSTASVFEGKPGRRCSCRPAVGRLAANAVLLVGVGDPDEGHARRAPACRARRWRRSATKVRAVATSLLDAAPEDRSTPSAGRAGARRGRAARRRTSSSTTSPRAPPAALRRVVVLDGRAEVRRGARPRRSDRPRRDLGPRHRERAVGRRSRRPSSPPRPRRLLAGTGVTVQVLTEAQIRAQRMGGVLGVGQGSARPPRFLKMTYEPSGRPRGRLALVGKGVVFDTGGISIKPAGGMETMKTDMAGGAAVVGAMSVLKQTRRAGPSVVGYVPLVENMPSGTAIRPGDVLRIRNGKTVEVLNTDAEGRLILADALVARGRRRRRRHRRPRDPHRGVRGGAGREDRGPHGQRRRVVGAGAARRPTAPASRCGRCRCPPSTGSLLESEIADLAQHQQRALRRRAARPGLFLQQFVGDRPWVHLDIAGPPARRATTATRQGRHRIRRADVGRAGHGASWCPEGPAPAPTPRAPRRPRQEGPDEEDPSQKIRAE